MSSERQQRAVRAEQMRKERQKAERKQRNFITIGIVVVVLALIGVGGYAVKSTSDSRAKETDVITPKGATGDHGVMYTAEDAGGKASPDAVKVVLYEDFQCPVCKAFEQVNGPFLVDAVKKGDIEIEYRIITFLDRSSPNKYSSRSGSAALCAYEAGGGEAYKKVHDALYANQPEEQSAGPEDPALADMLKQTGVSGAKVDSCVVTNKFVPWLDEATKASRDAKITGTPTVQIDGKTVTGANKAVPQAADLQKAIDAAKNA